ncbi:hypothetical protein H0X90_34610 [Burkholderia sp. 9775_39]|uniref:hypothetical protein n=1 Tax=unclassified Burkholderia TaxID=2613784 RepID=UPI0018C37110|nr:MULTISPECIES: hypothetical protein [unclassified Burkholderia]MBG0881935.1 hypothetical protein [Burkholderia sp. 9775_39]MBG0888862.1 hypothetical protein [Burkholderia sp. 9773_38]
MSTTKVWNLTYALGNTSRIVGDASNPQARTSAIKGAEKIAGNGWRVWVEHHKTGERIFESQSEKAYRETESV